MDDQAHLFQRTGGEWRIADASGVMVPFSPTYDLAQAMGEPGMGLREGRFIPHAPNDMHLSIGPRVLHYDGTRWREVAALPAAGRYVLRATVTQAGEITGVGRWGLVLSGKAAPWTVLGELELDVDDLVETPSGGVIARDSHHRHTAVNLGVLLDGTLITGDYAGAVAPLVRSGVEDLWVTDKDGSLRHFDGRAWASVPVDIGRLGKAWTAGDLGWVLGSEGIARRDRAAWTAVPLPAELALVDVWAAAADDAWAIADEIRRTDDWHEGSHVGTILRWDGQRWRVLEQRDAGVQAIAGYDAAHVWLASEGELLRWEGSAWQPAPGWTPLPEGERIVAIAAPAANDLWVADEHAVHHYDGERWTTDELHAFTTGSLFVQSKRVWISGFAGLLAKSR
jgi:hypothetical protein